MKSMLLVTKHSWEDESVRNVAFSIMLGALALLQIAVVAGELFHSGAQTVAARSDELNARQALASNETTPKRSTF